MIIITLTYTRPLEEIDALMSQHVAWLKAQYSSGAFIASGRQKPRTGGVILAKSGDPAALREAMAGDPFVANGVATFEMCEFTPSMTAPGAEVLRSL